MPPHGHRRRVLVYLAAVIAPSVVLAVLGRRTIAQERELAENRLAEERRRLDEDVRHALPDGRSRFTLTDYNVFLSDRWVGRMGAPTDDLYIEQRSGFDFRSFHPSFTTRFGTGREGTPRATASADERGRI